MPLAAAAASFALMYSSHMVLQSSPQQANVWGWAASAAPLTLTLTESNSRTGSARPIAATLQKYNSTAWTWHVLLPATPASATPYALAIGGATIDDVLFGDVWVCSG